MKLKLLKLDGTEAGEHELSNFPQLEDGKGVDALRQVILAVRANKRQGNASTKLRSEVSGSGKRFFGKRFRCRKSWRQASTSKKGWWGCFWTTPSFLLPKTEQKVRKLAFQRALIDQADSDNLILIEDFTIEAPKTKQLNQLVKKIVPESPKTLLVSDQHSENIILAGRNLPNTSLSSVPDLGPVDIFQADKIIFSVKGIESLLTKLGNS